MYTTSRYASIATRKKAKSLAAKSKSKYVARAKHTLSNLISLARKIGEDHLFILEEKQKKPDRLLKIQITETGEWLWV